jgi:5-methylcytosine-specific restriction enzyme B
MRLQSLIVDDTTKLSFMPTFLRTDEDLRQAAYSATNRMTDESSFGGWVLRLTQHIAAVQSVAKEEFRSEAFQRQLWDGEAVSATGMGQIDVSNVIRDPVILDMLWSLKTQEPPADPAHRIAHILAGWQRVFDAITPLVTRKPKLKMYRVFAALFPADFTTVAHASKLRALARAMGLPKPSASHPVELHRAVLDRLAQVLGLVPAPPTVEGVQRMALPWLLYAANVQEQADETTVVVDAATGTETLNPLPAARRRKGLTAIGGSLPAIRSMIEFAGEGCTREDFKAHIRAINPKLNDSSVSTVLNSLMAEWGVLRANGDELALTPRGEAFLEGGDPDEFSDWLLTRILGFDHVLVQLADAPITKAALIAFLQKVNAGWTNQFGPSVIITWARTLGLVRLDKADGLLHLTPEGVEWRERITWEPEFLQSEGSGPDADAAAAGAQPPQDLRRPTLARMIDAFPAGASFPSHLIARLDAGLWHNSCRHFAVLAGLSGAGKTLLARCYALALWAGEDVPTQGLLTLPVQPGWHDPSSLLGYVNPLVSNTYMRTGFLDFLLQAAGDPSRPYTIVLDEMNLSHPEQYLAPLLSAMETGEAIEFHTSDEEITGVPPSIPYPANLVLIGTVNMDETTHGLSDKVLDRACVLDFWEVDVAGWPSWGSSGLAPDVEAQVRELLVQLGAKLRPVRLHFGWRTIADVVGYVRSAAGSGTLESTQALDHAIYGKVLPKLRGEDTERLRVALATAGDVLKQHGLKESADKVAELAKDLAETGSARFWR